MMRPKSRTPWGSRAAALTAAAMACCAFVSASARADERADALLAKATAAYKAAKSLTADVRITMTQGAQTHSGSGSFRLRKPKLMRVAFSTPQKITLMSDGKRAYQVMDNSQYKTLEVDAGVSEAASLGGIACGLFFGNDSYILGKMSDTGAERKYSGKQAVAGVSYDVVTITNKKPIPHTLKLYFRADGLIARSVTDAKIQTRSFNQTMEWSNEKLNGVPSTQSFAIALPKGAKPFVPPQPSEDNYEAKLVPVGKPAPVFAMPNSTGGSVSLSESTADHKAVLVNFWFYG